MKEAETELTEEEKEIFSSCFKEVKIKKRQFNVQKVPQYALASYLGMTTEFLSRIRNKRVTNKK